MNKKVTFLFIGDSKGRIYFTMNKFHTKISNGEFFPKLRYADMCVCIYWIMPMPKNTNMFVSVAEELSAVKIWWD